MESKENKEQIEEKFQAKLQGLLEMAKKKKMVIEDTEIIRYFNDAKEIELNLERMERSCDTAPYRFVSAGTSGYEAYSWR